MSKFLDKYNLDKQIEKRAIRYFLDKVGEAKKEMAKEYAKDKENLKQIKQAYLEDHPKVKKDYEEKKKNQLKLKIGLATGALTVGTVAGALMFSDINEKTIVDNSNDIKIEQLEQNNKEQEETKEEVNQYAEFFEMIENEDNTNRRNEIILNQTKEIIVNAYNKENPNTPITTEKLQILILSESVLVKTDRLGNTTYERSTDIGYNDLKENEQLVSKGKVYVFSIDGNNVATFMENGDRLEDKSIENEELFFGKSMNMVKQYQKLSDNFKHPTTEKHTNIAEESYKEEADKLLGENNLDKEVEKIAEK